MADYTPRCYILDTKTMSVEVVLLQTYGEVSSISASREDTELNIYKEGLPSHCYTALGLRYKRRKRSSTRKITML